MDNFDKEFYDKVGKIIGWDFSNLHVETQGEKWDFYSLVDNHLDKKMKWLDIGTGGGEKVLPLAEKVNMLIGIDYSQGMIDTAKKNLKKMNISNADFQRMNINDMTFSSENFDIITNRHSEINAKEIFRTLKKDGIFMTQQVENGNKQNIKDIFGRGQNYGESKLFMEECVRQLRKNGFSEIDYDSYDAQEYYRTEEDILFLLKNTPTIPDFGKINSDLKCFEEFVKKYMTEKGIVTNSKRFLITAKK